MRTLNLKSGYPTVDAARRRLLAEIEAARGGDWVRPSADRFA